MQKKQVYSTYSLLLVNKKQLYRNTLENSFENLKLFFLDLFDSLFNTSSLLSYCKGFITAGITRA